MGRYLRESVIGSLENCERICERVYGRICKKVCGSIYGRVYEESVRKPVESQGDSRNENCRIEITERAMGPRRRRWSRSGMFLNHVVSLKES